MIADRGGPGAEMDHQEQVFLSATQAAAYLGVGRSAFYQHFLTPKRVPVVRIGKRVLIHRDDLEQLADALRADAMEAARQHSEEIARLAETLQPWTEWTNPTAGAER